MPKPFCIQLIDCWDGSQILFVQSLRLIALNTEKEALSLIPVEVLIHSLRNSFPISAVNFGLCVSIRNEARFKSRLLKVVALEAPVSPMWLFVVVVVSRDRIWMEFRCNLPMLWYIRYQVSECANAGLSKICEKC